MAARVKMKVKAGPASTSYLIPTGEYSHLHGTPLSSVQLVLEGVEEGEEGERGKEEEGGRERGRGSEEKRERGGEGEKDEDEGKCKNNNLPRGSSH